MGLSEVSRVVRYQSVVAETTDAKKAVKKEITTVRRLAALWSPRYFTCFGACMKLPAGFTGTRR